MFWAIVISFAAGVAAREFWPQEKTWLGKLGQAAWAKVKAKLGLK